MKKQNKGREIVWDLLPVALIVMIVPLLVHLRSVPISKSALDVWKTDANGLDWDFFSYYKAMFFLGFCALAAVCFGIRLVFGGLKIKKTYFYIPMGIYALFAVISTLASSEKDVSLLGFPNRYEGLFVLLGYMCIMFIIINLVNNARQIKLVLGGLLVSSLVIGLIAVFQYFNMDLFQTKIGNMIMLPVSMWKDMLGQLNFRLGPRAAYGTLFHTNYVGSFSAMVLPMALGIYIFSSNWRYKAVFGFMAVLMFACLMGSHSRTGFMGVGFAVLMTLVLARKKLIPNAVWIAALVVLIAGSAYGISLVSKGQIVEKIGTLYNDSAPSLTSVVGIKDINVTKEQIMISDGINVLKLAFDGKKIQAMDTDSKRITMSKADKNNKVTLSDPRYKDYEIALATFVGYPVIEITKGAFKIDFVVSKDGYRLYDGRGNALAIEKIESWGFKGYENLGSARGYIWSRSLPLLKKTLLAGFGPDTFAIHFPQNDCIGKFLAYNDATIIVDKPHNIYLQTGINTGVISLLAQLALFLMYFISSMKLFLKRSFHSFLEIAGAGVFTAVCGYLVAGLGNDSAVSVAPVFWVLLGLGLSINMLISSSAVKSEEVNVK